MFFCVLIVLMKVTEINSKTSFKAIKLTRQESNKVGEYFRVYRNLGNLEARSKIVDIFTPHIEKEAKTMAEEDINLSVKDYAQNLYLRLLEKIETINLKFHPVTELTNNLNNYRPQKEDYITILENKSIEELTPEEQYIISNKDQSTLKEKMHQIIEETPNLRERSKNIVQDYLDGYSYKVLCKKYELTTARVHYIIDEEMRKIRCIALCDRNSDKDYIYLTLDESY